MKSIGMCMVLWICGCSQVGSSESPSQPKGDEVQTIPEGLLNRTGVSLALEGRSEQEPYENKRYEQLELRLVNRGESPISFHGYAPSQPWYRIERWIEGRWQAHQVGWFCGTGLKNCIIPRQKSVIIPVTIQKDLLPLRVGVSYAEGKQGEGSDTVWSARIDAD